MADMDNIVKLAVDGYKGRVEKYSVAQSQEALRQALIEVNNGSTKLDYKAIRDGKCAGLFALVETILSQTVVDGLTADDFFVNMVDFRNIAAGDKNLFIVEDGTLYVVDDAADGTQAVRRQRIAGATEVSINTSMKVVRIYEELSRVLAGRVDFNHLIDVVAESFRQRILQDVYTLWSGATAQNLGGVTYFPAAGTYNEDDLLDLIAHVEAAAGGRNATIIGTKKACRQLAASIMSEQGRTDLYDLGYYGKFYGTPVIGMPQRHKVGTSEFIFDDKVLTIIAGDQKPFKFVYEGDPIAIMKDPTTNMDLTPEYFFGEKWGVGIVMAGGNSGVGRYQTL